MTEQNLTEQAPSFFRRLAIAFAVFRRAGSDPQFAGEVAQQLRGEVAASTAETRQEQGKPERLEEASPASALQLLGLLQQEGRFVDFIEEDVSAFSDAQVGAAVRVVHEGCRKALNEHLTIEAIRPEQESSRVTLEAGFDASAIRLTGNLVGQPPFSGTLVHRGWRVTGVKLPKLAKGHNMEVLAPAEVEL